VLGSVQRFVDVHDGAITQATSERIVLFAGHVAVNLAQQLDGLVEAARTVVAYLHRRMVMDVLAVVDGRLLDLTDRLVDFGDGDGRVWRRCWLTLRRRVAATVNESSQ
jgi:hypothetical protein